VSGAPPLGGGAWQGAGGSAFLVPCLCSLWHFLTLRFGCLWHGQLPPAEEKTAASSQVAALFRRRTEMRGTAPEPGSSTCESSVRCAAGDCEGRREVESGLEAAPPESGAAKAEHTGRGRRQQQGEHCGVVEGVPSPAEADASSVAGAEAGSAGAPERGPNAAQSSGGAGGWRGGRASAPESRRPQAP